VGEVEREKEEEREKARERERDVEIWIALEREKMRKMEKQMFSEREYTKGLEKDKKEERERIETIERELFSMRERERKIEKERENVKKTMSKIQIKLAIEREKVAKLKERVKLLEKDSEEEKGKVATLESVMEEEKEKVETLESEMEEEKKKVATLEKEKDRIKAIGRRFSNVREKVMRLENAVHYTRMSQCLQFNDFSIDKFKWINSILSQTEFKGTDHIAVCSHPLSTEQYSCWSVTLLHMFHDHFMVGITADAQAHKETHTSQNTIAFAIGEEYYVEYGVIKRDWSGFAEEGQVIFLYDPFEHTLSAYNTDDGEIYTIPNIPPSPDYKVMVYGFCSFDAKIEVGPINELSLMLSD